MSTTNLFAEQEANRRSSAWLVAGFVLFFAWLGFGGDLAWYLMTRGSPDGGAHLVPVLGIVMLALAGGIAWTSFRNGPQRVLWSTGAWEIIEPVTEAQKRLVNVVEEMAIASGVPRPRVWVVPDADPNAFATGLDTDRANIAVTEGLLQTLSRDELQGVVAHEMSHIRNLDVRLMTLLAAMVGAIALLSDGTGRLLRGARVPSGAARRAGGKKGGQLGLIVLVFWLISLVLAPIISRLLSMAVSRRREYLADATGAQFTRNPMALAHALEKLEGATGATRSIKQGSAHLCIVDPQARAISSREGFLGDFLASHPPMRQRIARLKAMGYQMEKQGMGSRE